ncbi:hypothetical protein HMPREF6485_1379 [Segatella buccae ATCC 33574]|uniref:Uncharacterized protein n=1 Tax=Segatella buccae ATCC 33574 TaxID=873513 RepID=E6K6X9_9BACT|nr:hypothetical protein HMPREF6485_1379 [Segatella buccae ATCC 33574]
MGPSGLRKSHSWKLKGPQLQRKIISKIQLIGNKKVSLFVKLNR